MVSFTSDRERRLWSWTAALVALIYTTLTATRPVASFLRERGMLEWTFTLGTALIAIVLLGSLWTRRPDKRQILAAVLVVGTYVTAFAFIHNPAERTHLIEYGGVATLAYQALSERRRNGGEVPVPWLLAMVFTGLAGLGDELIQGVLPTRVFDWRDVGFNLVAGVLGVVTTAVLTVPQPD